MLYEISDLFYTSKYEGKRDNYKNKMKKLKVYKSDLDRVIAECDEAIRDFQKIYEEDSALSKKLVPVAKKNSDSMEKFYGKFNDFMSGSEIISPWR